MCERRSRAGGTMKSASSPPMNSERQSMRSRISAPPEMPSGALLWRAAGEVRSSPLASKHRLADDFDHGQSQEPSLVPGGYLLCIARRMRLAGCVLLLHALTCGRLRSPPFQSPAQRDQTRPGDRRRCRLGRVHITEGLFRAVEIGRYLHPVVRAHGKSVPKEACVAPGDIVPPAKL